MATDKIRDLLIKASDGNNVSRRELASRIGVPPQSVNNWIDSKLSPNNESLKKLAKYFKVRPGDLINDQEAATSPLPSGGAHVVIQEDVVKCTVTTDVNLIGKASIVLSSDTIYGTALAQNIDAFYQAVINESKEKETSLGVVSGATTKAAGDAG